jgi:hypothetical protein
VVEQELLGVPRTTRKEQQLVTTTRVLKPRVPRMMQQQPIAGEKKKTCGCKLAW